MQLEPHAVTDNRARGADDEHLAQLIARATDRPTPAFWISQRRVLHNYAAFEKGLPGARIFYPVKVNPHPALLRLLDAAGASFDAASLAEILLLLSLQVEAEKIAFTTPVKRVDEIRDAANCGVDTFVADNEEEIHKLAAAAPGSRVLIRLKTRAAGSQWPLSHRFGAEPETATVLLALAARMKLVPYGLAFHVGSQCTRIESWTDAVEDALAVAENFERTCGQPLRVLDIGGGFPVRYTSSVPGLAAIFAAISRSTSGCRLQIWAEPGRALVGDAAIATTAVIGQARHGDSTWLFCDLGAFNGLLELIEPSSLGFSYEILSQPIRSGAPMQRYGLAGPSCDGDDVIARSAVLPAVKTGDRLHLLKVGAYSIAYASRFCGNAEAAVYLV